MFSRECTGEGELGAVSDGSSDVAHLVVGVAQQTGGQVDPHTGQVGQRSEADHRLELAGSARISKLRAAAHEAGRIDEVPVTVFGAEPEAAHLTELREIGVNRALLYAPPTDADAVRRFLDQTAPLATKFQD